MLMLKPPQGSLVGALVISLLIYYLWWRPRRKSTPVVHETPVSNSGLATKHQRIPMPSSSQSALMGEEDKPEDPSLRLCIETFIFFI